MTRCQCSRSLVHHALGQKSLELRIDRAIVRRYLIKGRFCSARRPSWSPCGDERVGTSPLDGVERARPSGRQVTGEVFEKALLAQPKYPCAFTTPALAGGLRNFGRAPRSSSPASGARAAVVDQSRDDWVVARFTDNRPCE